MSSPPVVTFWIPLLLTLFGLFIGVGFSLASSVSPSILFVTRIAAVVSVLLAGLLAYRGRRQKSDLVGGRGGNADVYGNESIAIGGRGGHVSLRGGGDGGDARVKGNRSVAKGGDGGAG